MPIPMYDASQALKTNPEKTEEALQKVPENQKLHLHELTFELSFVSNNSEHMNRTLHFLKPFSHELVFL